MDDQINRLLWQDWDGFVNGLKQIAKEETERKVISGELKGWWTKLHDVLCECPHLPKDN